ncbi:MAG TPA: LptF/LptG family permease [Vicinamibacterales bacterium]|nr:LptF/LptG family permease [Vicinamibacterales bacterium]
MNGRPGALLRAVAARLCGADVVERVIDSALADFHVEADAATQEGRPWRRRWLRATLSIALTQAIVVCAWDRLRSEHADPAADEARAVLTAVIATTSALAVFVVLPLAALTPLDWRLVPLVVPQAVPVALPIGVTFGVLAGREAATSARFRRTFSAIALACSAVSFVVFAWIVPEANQMFRELAFERFAQPPIQDGVTVHRRRPLQRGTNELTIGMLRQRMRAESQRRDRPIAAFSYHQRWALPAANLFLTAFTLTVIARWRPGRIGGAAIALSTCIAYWLLIEGGRQYGLAGTWPIAAAAWLPNLFFAGTAVAIAVSATRDRQTRPRSG